jgi:hypothetical protein
MSFVVPNLPNGMQKYKKIPYLQRDKGDFSELE